jgi:hypothetical protein
MCRNIRVLYNFEPPTTKEEMEAAALQYVRKVSGLAKPSATDRVAFERAVRRVTEATETLLDALLAEVPTRTREHEKEKAQARWKQREARLRARG